VPDPSELAWAFAVSWPMIVTANVSPNATKLDFMDRYSFFQEASRAGFSWFSGAGHAVPRCRA